MLQPHDSVPHFRVKTIGGEFFSYDAIWQRKNLVLVVLTDAGGTYGSSVAARSAEFRQHETECVVTLDEIPGLAAPGLLIADRWGEIVFVKAAPLSTDLPAVEELMEWVGYLQRRCPECEGEAR
jgi:hypothetical protein